ncbi:MAG: glycosyltransferase family 9 protein [Crocinitomicaceae bacterium]|nr:glycosyltransferase family 9 protein [Crocinitomicaceae bacterium]
MKKVLFIHTAFIGDVILFTAILEQWSRKYPESKMDVLVRKGNESLVQNHPHVGKVYCWDKKQNKYQNLFKIIREIRNEKYDLVVNFQRFTASGLVTILSKAKETRGFDKNPLSRFFSKKLPHEIGNGQHETERNLSLIQDLVGDEKVLPKLYPTQEDLEIVKSYQSEKYVTMAPTSVWFTKQLPFEKWKELIAMIPKDFKIFLLGAPGDLEFCNQLMKENPEHLTTNLCGKLSLVQSAVLMQRAEMNYMNDSAPLHLASAMNAKTTAFFCSTVPEFGFGPLAEHAKILQTEDQLDCRPCGLHGYKECPKSHFKCGYDINLKTNLEA